MDFNIPPTKHHVPPHPHALFQHLLVEKFSPQQPSKKVVTTTQIPFQENVTKETNFLSPELPWGWCIILLGLILSRFIIDPRKKETDY
ncbi:MAG TPA: hypothetical protein V6C96_01495 [Vampirovibrionales bacterium]